MASNITVSGLVVAPGAQMNLGQWEVSDPNANGLPYRQYDRTELWAATTNDRSAATLVAEGQRSAAYVFAGLDQRYHWIRAKDKEGSYGAWYPEADDEGVVASSPWQTYSATVEPTSGAFGSHTVDRAVYYRTGPLVTFNLYATVTDNGTGDVAVEFTLPVAPLAITPVSGASVNDADVYRGLAVVLFPSGMGSATLSDSAYPIFDDTIYLSISGQYEAA